ncbi:ribosomal protein L32e [Kipferlia bialata]|uniref:Ribosomal protein L32e n=1 Tax=Kipferlia bialata TaxID=797122 RepID=A0A391NLE6_9EUKA|nr:ribosomal protein L32e [Kipferlia bialata]|eukprot:g4720.t1
MTKTFPNSGPKVVKKRNKHFDRLHSDRFDRVSTSWRRPRGIDSWMRIKCQGRRPLVSIGYGSNKKTKNVLPSGYLKYSVNNVADLSALVMQNKVYAAEIHSCVSTRKRMAIIAEAKKLGIRVLNEKARLTTEEQ